MSALGRAAGGGERWRLLAPAEALAALRPGDVALGRLDVLETRDGVDDGLWALGELEARGVRVLNGGCPRALSGGGWLHRGGVPRRPAVVI